jgi:hypothetical protein
MSMSKSKSLRLMLLAQPRRRYLLQSCLLPAVMARPIMSCMYKGVSSR